MIVTVKTSKAGMAKAWFESIKYGLDFEPHADNTFDITVHRNDQLDGIMSACAGEIVARQNYVTNWGDVA